MEKKRLSRREFLGLAAGAASGAVLAGCAAPTPEVIKETVVETVVVEVAGEEVVKEVEVQVTVPPEEVITLEWWAGWPGPVFLAIAKAFEDEHPNIKLNPGLFYYTADKLLAAVAGGNPPDLAEDLAYMELIARGACMPLDDMIETSDEVEIGGDIPEFLWEVHSWEGKHYGIPSIATSIEEGMSFNLDLVEQAGLDPENLPDTWEGVLDWHKKITTYDDAGNLDILGCAPMAERTNWCSEGIIWIFPALWGFHYITEDLKYDIDREETVEFLSLIKAFYDEVGAEKMEAVSAGFQGIERGAFGVGKQAMQVSYMSAAAAVWQVNPAQRYKFTWVPVPESRKGTKVATRGGHAGVVMKNAKHPDEAFELAVFLTQPVVCDMLFEVYGWFGPRKSWRETVDLSFYPEQVQENILYYANAFDEADELWWDKDPIEGVCSNEWTKAWQGVVYGEFTAEEAAVQMQANMTKELERTLEERG